jgi:hypothetical protein
MTEYISRGDTSQEKCDERKASKKAIQVLAYLALNAGPEVGRSGGLLLVGGEGDPVIIERMAHELNYNRLLSLTHRLREFQKKKWLGVIKTQFPSSSKAGVVKKIADIEFYSAGAQQLELWKQLVPDRVADASTVANISEETDYGATIILILEEIANARKELGSGLGMEIELMNMNQNQKAIVLEELRSYLSQLEQQIDARVNNKAPKRSLDRLVIMRRRDLELNPSAVYGRIVA